MPTSSLSFQYRLGEVVRAARMQRDWSQADLAERVGVDRKTINRVETGTHSTLVTTLHAIATALGQPTWVLLRAVEE